jgi:outer membrane protein assembly factor BamB
MFSVLVFAPKVMAQSSVDWWPTFRHDLTHSGISTSAGSLTNQLLWSYKTGNLVDYSSAAAINGVVYVGSDDHYVYALNAANGAFVWSYKTGGSIDSSPTVDSGVVYIGSEDHKVYALNATTGGKIWSYGTDDEVESSPAVVNGVVYVGSDDNKVYALNATTGTKIWSYGTGNFVDSTPAVVNDVVYVGSSPVVANGVVYVGSNDNNIYAFGTITVPQLSPPAVPEFPSQVLDLSLIAIMACAALPLLLQKRRA